MNFILYQSGWFALVLGAANDLLVPGALFAIATVAIHIAISKERVREIKIALVTTLIGAVAESIFRGFDVFQVIDGDLWPPLAPPWLLIMWTSFAMTFHGCMSWILKRHRLALLLGVIFGPIAYWSGGRLGAVTIEMTPRNIILLAATFGPAFWLAVRYALHAGTIAAKRKQAQA